MLVLLVIIIAVIAYTKLLKLYYKTKKRELQLEQYLTQIHMRRHKKKHQYNKL